MNYYRFIIKTTESREEDIAFLLSERFGIDSVETRDNAFFDDSEREGGFFPELQPDLPYDDKSAEVLFYIENDGTKASEEKRDALLSDVKEILLENEKMIFEEACDSQWVDKWKEFFHSFTINDLLIMPSWESEALAPPHKKKILIDPGITFGTGAHESTRLAIEGLQKYLSDGMNFLDIGTGSGILILTALNYGAEEATATDIDPFCEETVYENMEKNGLDKRLASVFTGDITRDKSLIEKVGKNKYDICAANILADIIIPMAPYAYTALKKDGIFITSGIIDFKADEVKEALERAGFSILEEKALGEWRSFVARK